MPELADRRTAPRLSYDDARAATLLLNGRPCPVLDLGRQGLRYELPALPVRPAASAEFEGELALACGERIRVLGHVVRTHGHVAAAHLVGAPLTDLQLAREVEHVRTLAAERRASEADRRRWRARPENLIPHDHRRSEA